MITLGIPETTCGISTLFVPLLRDKYIPEYGFVHPDTIILTGYNDITTLKNLYGRVDVLRPTISRVLENLTPPTKDPVCIPRFASNSRRGSRTWLSN